jgi:hypothetical protein
MAIHHIPQVPQDYEKFDLRSTHVPSGNSCWTLPGFCYNQQSDLRNIISLDHSTTTLGSKLRSEICHPFIDDLPSRHGPFLSSLATHNPLQGGTAESKCCFKNLNFVILYPPQNLVSQVISQLSYHKSAVSTMNVHLFLVKPSFLF